MKAVILPRSNRTKQRGHDVEMYKLRRLIEKFRGQQRMQGVRYEV